LHFVQIPRVVFELPELTEVPLVGFVDEGVDGAVRAGPEPVNVHDLGLVRLFALVIFGLFHFELHAPALGPQRAPLVRGRLAGQVVLFEFSRRRVFAFFVAVPPLPPLRFAHRDLNYRKGSAGNCRYQHKVQRSMT
jgi:hypothetical protein